MVVLLAQKHGLSFKFPFKLENHKQNSKALSASLDDFRSKISNFVGHTFLKPGNESEPLSLAWFHNCFELMHVTNRAFAELVVEMDYPMKRWGGKAAGEYLNYTLILLNMLNSISSSLSHLNQAKISIFYGVSLLEKSPSSTKCLTKITKSNLGKEFKLGGSAGVEIRPGSDQKECVILQALILLKKIGLLATSLVLSGLDSGAKLDVEIGRFPGGSDDQLKKVLEARFWKGIEGPMEEVKEVNCAIEGLLEAILAGRFDESVREMKGKMKVLENSIQSIENEVNNLFSKVIAARNKLLDSILFLG